VRTAGRGQAEEHTDDTDAAIAARSSDEPGIPGSRMASEGTVDGAGGESGNAAGDATGASVARRARGTTAREGAPSYVVSVVVVCLLALIASAAVLAWSVLAADGADGDTTATDAVAVEAYAQDRREVLELTQEFFVQANTFDSRDLTDYKDRVNPMLTPEFADVFQQSVDELLAKLARTKLRSEADFRVAAIESMDQSSAEVLVAGNGSTRSTLVDRLYFPRWRVSLVKGDSGWLVDNYEMLIGDGGTVIGQ